MEFLASFHPQLVHFPIALLSTYILFELLSLITGKEYFSKAAHILLLLGIIGALAAVLTGNQAEEVLEEIGKNVVPHELIEEHEEFANITIWYFFVLLVGRTFFVLKNKFTKKIKIIFAVLAIIGFFFIYETGEHGGKLVYKYGAGTELLKNTK
ncbi:MAG: DUF2231 domain-containing protein [Ignavibacteria bacterium]|nr:MAG: DUF2231 domain-containing protein [Ignavibacteria bacterium]